MAEAAAASGSAEPKKKRKKDKVRSAWPLQDLSGTLAKWHALSGSAEAAYQMLERVLAGGVSLQQHKSDPVFDGLRREARLTAVVERGASRRP